MKIPKRETRTFTCGLIDLAEQGLISWEAIARAALDYMSEPDVEDMAWCEFELEVEDEDEEEDEEDEEESDEDFSFVFTPRPGECTPIPDLVANPTSVSELFGEDELHYVLRVAWDTAGWESCRRTPYVFYAWFLHDVKERDTNKMWRRCRFSTEEKAVEFANAVMKACDCKWKETDDRVWERQPKED
jgi:hypothetical protein